MLEVYVFTWLAFYLGGLGIALVIAGIAASSTRWGWIHGPPQKQAGHGSLGSQVLKVFKHPIRRAFGKKSANWKRLFAFGILCAAFSLVFFLFSLSLT